MKAMLTKAIILSLLWSGALLADTQTTTSVIQDTTNPSVTTITTTTANTAQDEAIVAAIYANYAQDAALTGTTINVTSKGGVVTLTGTVTAQAQADQAVISAKSVPGVQDVRSNINVITNRSIAPNKVPNY